MAKKQAKRAPKRQPKSGAKKFSDAVARVGGKKALRKASQRMRDE